MTRFLSPVTACKGNIVIDGKTKNLLKRIRPGEIAVVAHEDIDEMAARGLVEARTKAVINLKSSLTGSYVTSGTQLLFENGIPVLDVTKIVSSLELKDGMQIHITQDTIYVSIHGQKVKWAHVRSIDKNYIEERLKQAKNNMEQRLSQFIDNTLEYAQKEKAYYLKPLPPLPLKLKIRNRHVLVVVRGKHYKEDLRAIRSYIDDYRPVLIGVDGGADALLEYGYRPDLIIGDMDSVSDRALTLGTSVVVHAYPDGRAPGLSRVRQLQVPAYILPAPGTSEDVAMLYAYEQGARWIVTLGAHSNMVDFLEKGRKGMASTVLVRMKIGTRLIDAKGVSMLYQKRLRWENVVYLGAAATFPVVALSMVSPEIRHIWQIIWLQIKMMLT